MAEFSDGSGTRRVAAVCLPELLCELAEQRLVPRTGTAASSARQAVHAVPKGHSSRRPFRSARSALPLAVVLEEGRTSNANNPSQEEKSSSLPRSVSTQMPLSFDVQPLEKLRDSALISAVNHIARRYGVREEQTVAEASALLAQLVIRTVSTEELSAALGKIADAAFSFGATVSIQLPNTVLVDVTGSAHLYGGEEALGLALVERVRAMGHVAQVALANGPILAGSFARFGGAEMEAGGVLIVAPSEQKRRLFQLPLAALALTSELSIWFARLGVITIGDFAKLPRCSVAARLGEDAPRVLGLLDGVDESPLVAYQPVSVLQEEITWDEPTSGVEPLLFAARRLAFRLGSRLEGLGKAAQTLELTVQYDAGIARHRKLERRLSTNIELATPLYRSEELTRIISVRLRALRLGAPHVGLRLTALHITRAPQLQLSLVRAEAQVEGVQHKGPEALPVLLAELAADIGAGKFGVLRLNNSHRPEQRAELVPVGVALGFAGAKRQRKKKQLSLESSTNADGAETSGWRSALKEPTRLLGQPAQLHVALKSGATFTLDHQLYSVEKVQFFRRLQSVEWWSAQEVSRDYVRLWLRGAQGMIMALAYVDKNTGKRFLQAFYD